MPRDTDPMGDVVGSMLHGFLNDYILPTVSPPCHCTDANGRSCEGRGILIRCIRCGRTPCPRHGHWSAGPPPTCLCSQCIAELEEDDDVEWKRPVPDVVTAPHEPGERGSEWPWSTLGIPPNAPKTVSTVRTAFTERARLIHPDHRPADEHSTACMEFSELVKARDHALQMILDQQRRSRTR